MNFKRYVEASDTWVDSHYIMGTSTDTITTPADIYVNDTTATVGLKGNMYQASGVSPTTPIQPSECGERTGNLAPPLTEWVDGYIIGGTGGGNLHEPTASKEKASDFIEVLPNTTYAFSFETGNFIGGTNAWRTIAEYNERKEYIIRPGGASETPQVFTTSSSTKYLRLSYRSFGSSLNTMLNLGSTASSYEPYGYKIPISSANTTTPIYLGEVETERKIGKLVLTGSDDENWSVVTLSTNDCIFRLDLSDYPLSGVAPISTHYTGSTADLWVNVANNEVTISIRSLHSVAIHHSGLSGVTDWKAYLAQQYANGTPVTVWYVLATPTTAVVNEPLRKIGDYADTLSNISIPVTAGGDTISVGTSVQPSEVTVNYKGWHPVQSVHERENGQWD